MQTERKNLFIEKNTLPRQVGMVLIVSALVFFLFVTTVPELWDAHGMISAAYLLLGIGTGLLVLHKALKIIRHYRLRDAGVRCLRCGWQGTGQDWFRYGCCPDCDSDQVVQKVLRSLPADPRTDF